jgi:adenosylhomocysteine nucleosidase
MDQIQVQCEFAVVFALAIEAGGLVDRLKDAATTTAHGFTARRGELRGRQVALVESGPGADSAAAATHAVLDAHRPALVFSAGFAGGLTPALARGDLVVAQRIVDEHGHSWDADPATFPDWIAEVKGLHVGRLVTLDHPLRTAEEKTAAGHHHAALAVDMESIAVAEVCRQKNVAFLAVRAVSDALDDELPADVAKLLYAHGARQLGAALGTIWRKPGRVKDLFRLQRNALAASERLAEFISAAVKHWPTA